MTDIVLTIQEFWCLPENRILITCGAPSILVILSVLIVLGVNE